VNWIHLAHDRESVVDSFVKGHELSGGFHKTLQISWLAEQLLAAQERYSLEFAEEIGSDSNTLDLVPGGDGFDLRPGLQLSLIFPSFPQFLQMNSGLVSLLLIVSSSAFANHHIIGRCTIRSTGSVVK
jgi:hypothetical protein